MKTLKERLEFRFHHPNYSYFMVSLFVLIAIPPFAAEAKYGVLFMNISFGLVVVMAAYFTSTSFKELIYFSILGAILYFLFLFNNDVQAIRLGNALVSLLFFSLVFRKLIYYILNAHKIGINAVFASVAGYLILGLIATPILSLIELSYPLAFTLPPDHDFYDFLYFTYITLTTVGYGDIVPVHPIAKSFSLIIAILGQLYLTILIAIIIGKYMMYETRRAEGKE